MADGEISQGIGDRKRSRIYSEGRLLKSMVSLHCCNADIIMMEPLTSHNLVTSGAL